MRLPITMNQSFANKSRPVNSMRSLMDDFRKNAFAATSSTPRMMAMDIVEKMDEFVLTANTPGIKKDNIKILVDGKDLIIEATREQEKRGERETRCCCERYLGDYRRVFSLPDNWDIENINATYEDGVLRLIVPKKKVKPEKEIKIL